MTGFVASVILAVVMAVESPAVQTSLAGKVLSMLESSLGGKIQVGSIAIKPISSFVLKDVCILDNDPWPDTYGKGYARADTVLYVGKLSGTFSIWGLMKRGGVKVSRLNIDDALFHIVSEPGEQWNNNLSRILRTPKPPEVPVEKPDLFEIKKLHIRNFRFRLSNLLPTKPHHRGVGFNWENLDIKVGEADAHNIHFTGGRMSFVLDNLNMEDRCGYKASLISGKAICGMGKVFIGDFRLVDEWSDLDMPSFKMTFDNAYAFKDYVNKISMDAILMRSVLSGKTLSYFMDALPEDNAVADIEEIRFSGTVNDFTVNSAKMKEKGSGTTLDLTAHVKNVTNLPKSVINAKIHNIGFTTSGISSLVHSITGKPGPDLSRFGKGKRYRLSGTVDGPIRDFLADISVMPSTGLFNARMNVRNITDKSMNPEIRGTAFSQDFDLGEILGNDVLGPVTMRTGLSARLVPGSVSVNIDSLNVSRLNALGYDYSGIAAAGKMTGKSFDGKIVCDDPNLNFLFQGICNISSRTQNALYHFYANLGYADLKALNLDKREGISRASCRVSANYLRIMKGDGIGDFKINDILLEDSNGIHDIGDATIDSRNGSDGYRILFKSSFAEGAYKGTGSLASFIGDLQATTTRRHLPALYPSDAPALPDSTGTYSVAFNFHDSRDLLSFVKPGLYIADSTSLTLHLNNDSVLNGIISSPRLAMGRNYIKGSRIHFDNRDNQINAILNNDEVRLAGLILRKSGITAHAKDNKASLGFNFQGDEPENNYGELYVDGRFVRDIHDSLAMVIQPLNSFIIQNGDRWDIVRSEVRMKGGRIDVDNFKVTNGFQSLRVNGGISPNTSDTLRLDIGNLELSLANGFTAKDFDIGGRTNGFAEVISPTSSGMQVVADLLCSNLKIGGEDVGELSVKGSWDEIRNRFNIDIKEENDGRNPLIAGGFIAPGDKTLDINASLDKLNLAMCSPLLSGVFSEMNGFASGTVSASGSLSNPQISSTGLSLEGAKIRLGATGVAYTLDGPVSVANDGLSFDGISVRDERDGRGRISGALLYNGPDDISLDTRVEMHNIQAINIHEKESGGIYGDLSANGDVRVRGPLENLNVTGYVSTSGAGQVHVPLNTAVASAGSDLLTFKEKEVFVYIDPYEQMISQAPVEKKRGKGNVGLHIHASASPEVKAVIELNKATGNVITASGTASVMFDMETASSKMNLAGDYVINNGNLHFELPGIVKKEFSIKDGSAIRFNGDVMNSDLDLTAIYNLKTSLSTLLSDTTSVSTRRPVECSIRITDKITNPQVSFGVEVPDLDPNSRTRMAEALNTEDKVQKQFMALLVMGTFLPNEQSGVVNGTNILYSNVSEIMSNQLNNILQKLNIPLDLGLGYQQSQGGTNIFDVAISTQLFNNRVEIGGTVGNRQYRTSKNPNGDVVGDIDISIKLDKPGQFKLNLFSHSADEYTSFLDYSQRNGIGVTYSKEYDNFWQMLKEIFTPRKKREQQAAEREAMRDRAANRRTITITE